MKVLEDYTRVLSQNSVSYHMHNITKQKAPFFYIKHNNMFCVRTIILFNTCPIK